jgi:hypothetical protein
LIEVERKKQADIILKCTSYFKIDATATQHQSLNSSKGAIKCSNLAGMIETDIAEELKSQQVSNVNRILSTRDGKRVPTNSLIVTFSTPIIPSSIQVGYLNVRVAVYIPNPMQCYKCFKFGHHEANCVRHTISRRCSSNHDKNETCNVPVKCANC